MRTRPDSGKMSFDVICFFFFFSTLFFFFLPPSHSSAVKQSGFRRKSASGHPGVQCFWQSPTPFNCISPWPLSFLFHKIVQLTNWRRTYFAFSVWLMLFRLDQFLFRSKYFSLLAFLNPIRYRLCCPLDLVFFTLSPERLLLFFFFSLPEARPVLCFFKRCFHSDWHLHPSPLVGPLKPLLLSSN